MALICFKMHSLARAFLQPTRANIHQYQYNNPIILNSCCCFYFVCKVFFVPFENFLTLPLSVRGCKFWLMLGTHCYWAVRVPHLLWNGTSGTCNNGYLRCQTFCMRGERSNRLRHRHDLFVFKAIVDLTSSP